MGVMVKEELRENKVEVGRVSNSDVAFEYDVLRLICGYVPQCRCLEEKQSFYDELKGVWGDMQSADDLVVPGRHQWTW